MRMYIRWAERRGFEVEMQDLQPGEEAGISRCSIRIDGLNAYGYAKAEREYIDWFELVLLTPTKEGTSLCSVDVIAEVEDDDLDMDIPEDDLRIDTYRSSGKGGQHEQNRFCCRAYSSSHKYCGSNARIKGRN